MGPGNRVIIPDTVIGRPFVICRYNIPKSVIVRPTHQYDLVNEPSDVSCCTSSTDIPHHSDVLSTCDLCPGGVGLELIISDITITYESK